MRRLGAFEAAVAHLRGPMRRGRPTRTHAPPIEFGGFDPPTFLAGFATAKRLGFELERSVSPARGDAAIGDVRGSAERRVGKEGVGTWRYWWSPYPYKKKQ